VVSAPTVHLFRPGKPSVRRGSTLRLCGFQETESVPMANILLLGADTHHLATDEQILRERGHHVLAFAGYAPALAEILANTDLVISDVSKMNSERWQQLKSINAHRKTNGDRLPIFCKSSVLQLPAIVLRVERLCTRFAYAK
jgi:hypothetical protein